MAFNYSPKVSNSGLMLYLDASNTKSYPRSGSIWNDLTPNKRVATLNNGPTFNASNGGSIVFDGIDDYADGGNIGNFPPQGTLNFWMNSSAVQDYRNVISTEYLGSNRGIRYEQYTNPTPYGGFNVLIGTDDGSQYTLYDYSPGAILTQNIWYCITLVWDVTNNRAIGYLNSTQKFDRSHTFWPTTIPSLSIGSGYDPSRYFKGNIAQVSIYNKALTAAEISQNYNTLRSRFGL